MNSLKKKKFFLPSEYLKKPEFKVSLTVSISLTNFDEIFFQTSWFFLIKASKESNFLLNMLKYLFKKSLQSISPYPDNPKNSNSAQWVKKILTLFVA